MPIMIGICGPSAAGKSYLASYLKEYFKDQVSIVSYDSYCRDFFSNSEAHINPLDINYDSPEAYEGSLLYEDLLKAKQGEDIHAPIYDFATHTRKKETNLIKNNKIIIVEGILIFQVKEILPLLDLKIFITANKEVRFERRSERDINERGRTLESVKEQWNSTVEPSRHLYIDTVKDVADIVIHNTGNNGIQDKAEHVIARIEELLNGNKNI